eukprot:1288508-Amorphochlora_amoeboformis.AAC.1
MVPKGVEVMTHRRRAWRGVRSVTGGMAGLHYIGPDQGKPDITKHSKGMTKGDERLHHGLCMVVAKLEAK